MAPASSNSAQKSTSECRILGGSGVQADIREITNSGLAPEARPSHLGTRHPWNLLTFRYFCVMYVSHYTLRLNCRKETDPQRNKGAPRVGASPPLKLISTPHRLRCRT